MSTEIQQTVSLPTSSVDALKQILQILVTLSSEKLIEMQDYLLFLQNQKQQTVHNGSDHSQEPSGYDILLTKQPNNGYLARPVLMPEIVVSGADEREALLRVGEAIASQVAESRVVRIAVPQNTQAGMNPWLRFAGEWGTEQEWEQFQADIQAFRQTLDRPTTDNLSNTAQE